MLFLIQWLGGVYCAKKMGIDENWGDSSGWKIWLGCVFIGWLLIILYILEYFRKSISSTSTKSSNTDTYYKNSNNSDSYYINQNIIYSDFVIENGILTEYKGNGGNIIIPDGVTDIGKRVFWGCETLESIIIPSSIIRIGNDAFRDCVRLTHITIPSNVTNIGRSAFEGCESLKSITIPSSVKYIGDCAFPDNCKIIRTDSQEPENLSSIKEVIDHDDMEKRGIDNNFDIRNQTYGDFYFFVINMPNTELINMIDSQYKTIKGTWSLAPCRGPYGSIEFASALLLWKYAINNFMSNQRAYGSLQITLGDIIGCAFFGMPAGEWSDKADSIMKNHSDVLTYDEWCSVYNYLRNNFADKIQSMEFNLGNAKQEVYWKLYARFIEIYNSTDSFSDMIDFYTMKGLKIKNDIRFKILS